MAALLQLTSVLRELALDPEARSSAAASVLQRLLSWLGFLQELLLSMEAYQRLLLFAYRQRHRATLAAALQALPPGGTFDSLPYYVDPQARQLLQFAALHALSTHLQADEVLAPAALLPQVSRVLLQTEEAQASKYLEAVAAALASQMNASLLMVDGMLLASLASTTFEAPPEAFLAVFSGTAAAGASGRAALKLQLAWLALRDALFALERPTVVFIRNAEQLLCSSFEAHDAFLAAFGSPEMLSLEGEASRAPLVLLGGVCVSESAAALAGVRPQKQLQPGYGPGGNGEEEEDAEGGLHPKGRDGGGGLFGGGGASGSLDLGDDELGLGDLLLSLSKLAGESQRPNARRLLLKVFPTRVKLQPPPAGPAALRHLARMQRDVAEAAEEDNYRVATAVAASTGVAVPPKASGIYSGSKALNRADWGKVLSWAVAIQTLQTKQGQLEEEWRQEEKVERQQLAAVHQAAAEGAAGEEGSDGSPQLGTPSPTGLRRRRRDSDGTAATSAADASQPLLAQQQRQYQAALMALVASAWQALNLLHLAAVAAHLPWQALRAACDGARWALLEAAGRLPLVGGYLEELLGAGQLTSEQLESELRDLEQELEALERRSAADSNGGGSAVGGASGAASTGSMGGGAGGSGTLRLSETSVRYGLGMLARSSGSQKQSIEPSNSYERQLLGEVLSPEDCGRGFSEVGALSEAKTALREAVQLPLKHPELFAGGTLARPSKGVLLFGPPGTGKTLVARAAAAECGAAFLALNPSAVASKWFGDSVKLIRATFTLAAKLAPCVIFIDEVDALLGKRNSNKEHEALREMKNELMSQWDGIRPGRERIMVLGATNRPFDLDEAVLRRFTHRIFIGLPDRAARAQILEVVLEGERLAPGVDLLRIADQTDGFSGSDLRQLCVQAAMRPVRTFLEEESSASAAATAAAAEAVTELEAVTGAAGGGSGSGEHAIEALGVKSAASLAGSIEEGQEENGSDGSVASAPAELVPAAAAQAGGSCDGWEAGSHPSLRLVPRLDSLLRQAERIASVPRNPKTDLRPVTMQDFEESLKEVGASVNPDSSTIQELNEWNTQYGTTANKQGVHSKRLSYYT